MQHAVDVILRFVDIFYKQNAIPVDDLIRSTLQTIENGMSADFIVIDLRSVWETLGEITGETAGEGIIDAIFSKFCLGK